MSTDADRGWGRAEEAVSGLLDCGRGRLKLEVREVVVAGGDWGVAEKSWTAARPSGFRVVGLADGEVWGKGRVGWSEVRFGFEGLSARSPVSWDLPNPLALWEEPGEQTGGG